MSSSKRIEDLLTPNARQALDEIVIEQRDNLLREAYESSSSYNESKFEISLRDILDARDKILFNKSIRANSEIRKKRFSVIFALTGVLYTFAGFFIYVIQNKAFDIEVDVGIIVAATGVFITFFGLLYSQLLQIKGKEKTPTHESEKNNISPEFLIVERWRIIEQILMANYENKYNHKPRSFNQTLDFLRSDSKFRDDSVLNAMIRELLNARNKVIHESYRMSDNKVKEYLNIADQIIERLEKNN